MFGAFRVHRVGLFFVSPCVHPRGVPDGKRCGGLRGTAAVCIHLLHCWHVHKLLPRSRRQQRRAAGQRGPPGPTVSNRKLNWTMKNQKGVLFCFFLNKRLLILLSQSYLVDLFHYILETNKLSSLYIWPQHTWPTTNVIYCQALRVELLWDQGDTFIYAAWVYLGQVGYIYWVSPWVTDVGRTCCGRNQ